MALYITREGPQAAINAFANLTTFGAMTLNQVVVPKDYASIKEMWVSATPDGNPNETLGCAFIVRLTGSGIKYGPVDLVVGGWGLETTGNDSIGIGIMSQVLPVDVAINPGGTIWVQFGQFGGSTTVGTPECAVTLCMTKSGAGEHYYVVRNMSDAGTANTKFPMTYSCDDTAANQIQIPNQVRRITKIFGAIGGIPLATTIGATTDIILEGNALVDGSIVRLPIAGDSHLSTGTGVSNLFMQAAVIPTDIAVRPGGYLSVGAEHSDDYGTPYTAVTLELST